MTLNIRILESAEDMVAIEKLQMVIWSGSDVDIVPLHLLVTLAQNGGLVIGAFEDSQLVGFLFGFPGLEETPEGFQTKHCSHQLGVHPAYRDRGIGFALKRAQWQIVRHQNLDLITWTYDPLESRNAYLNISKLGAICNNYKRDVYGDMRDDLNLGLPSDRFQVRLWVNSARVKERLGKQPRRKLDLAHYFQAGVQVLNPTNINKEGLPFPPDITETLSRLDGDPVPPVTLLEIPSRFQDIKKRDISLAIAWRLHTRQLFENHFAAGYLVTDFVFMPGTHPRSFYVLSDGESTLGN